MSFVKSLTRCRYRYAKAGDTWHRVKIKTDCLFLAPVIGAFFLEKGLTFRKTGYNMGMKVKELITELEKLDPELLVVMSKDGEGNSYSPLAGMYDNSLYVEDLPWCGEVWIHKLTDELKNGGYTEEDVADDGEPCVVLQPTN